MEQACFGQVSADVPLLYQRFKAIAAMEPTARHKPKILPIGKMPASSNMKVALPFGKGYYIRPTSKAPIGKAFPPQRTIEQTLPVKSSNVVVAKHRLLVAKVRQPSISLTCSKSATIARGILVRQPSITLPPVAKSAMIARGILAGPPITKYSGKYVSSPVTKSWSLKKIAAVKKAGAQSVALHE